MKKIYSLLILSSLICLSGGAIAQTTSFTTSGAYTYTVALGVTSVAVDMAGAQGGSTYSSGALGGKGGRVQATLAVSGGQILYVYVGGTGINGTGSGSHTGGYNGGGIGWGYGGSGGGMSDIRKVSGTFLAANELLVAAGGGGGGLNYGNSGEVGGYGGGTTGSAGYEGSPAGPTTVYGGAPGTPTAGGAGGTYCGAPAGSAGQGGNAAGGTNYAGGGGGGFYGGGVGCYGGGGGGSSWLLGTGVSAATTTANYQSGAGYVYITVLCTAPGAIVGAGSVCPGSSLSLTNPTGGSGGTWTSSNTTAGTINAATGVFTALAPGTSTITYVLASPCGGTNATATVTVLPLPGIITGTPSVCAGFTTTLADGGTGTWTTSNPAVATVSSGGVVTGLTAGTATISYTLSTGCAAATQTVTVNANPGPITGSNVVCGTLTTTLTGTPSGGTWSSSASATASVGSTTGVVTGGSAGTAIITYTLPAGCAVSFPMTVNPLTAITGLTSVCSGYTTSLTDATPGGVWSSTNTSVATVSSLGVVTSVSTGTTTISYYVATSGCAATTSVAITPPPTLFSVTGGGSTCPGGSVTVGLSGSGSGVAYTLFNGTTPILPSITAAGFAFNFPSTYTTTAGIYTVIAANGTPCATNMLGSATVTINPLPTPYTVSTSGGGAYCTGGTGVHVFLNSSQIGVNYQLFNGVTPVGSPISGTSASLDFGLQTTGTYTITGYNVSTTCTGPMANSVTITVNPLPTTYTISPATGGYCAGTTTGSALTLSGSQTGVSYQLLIGGLPVGTPVAGTAGSISLGTVLTAGTYSVQATNTSTGCTALMLGTSVITVYPLPTVYNVTGGGTICSGGAGADVQLNGSQTGVNYQLFRGGTALGTIAGTGSLLDFGLQTTAGSYTVVATNASTTGSCTNNMAFSANVFLNPTPASFTVTASALGYCAGGTGVHILLSGSVTGTTYTLYNGATIVSSLSGTGSSLDFGLQTAAGTYTVIATVLSTGCTLTMSGNPTIIINPLPVAYTVVVAGGGIYCAGGAGQVIGLSGSQPTVSYQLFRGGVAVGVPVSGTSSAISFPAQTLAGTYTIVGTNTGTLCSNNMTGSAAIIINPAPTVYNVTGGGGYCAGGTGNHIGLTGSDLGINYQLMNGGSSVGAPVAGSGGPIDFGSLTAAGTYTVVATNSSTGCTGAMSGSAIITINPLPPVNNVLPTGSANFCSGGTGIIIGLNGSVTGINYNLYNGSTISGAAVAGTGSPITFAAATASGIYTVVATNSVTGCISTMTGSLSVTALPLPTPYNVTGGGGYCAGGTGVHVGLSNSQSGKKYQLFNTSGPVTGALRNGNGFSLDFGLQTVAGTYTIVATDTLTSCTNSMSGSVTISINPLPTLYATGGGGNYCTGSTGPHVTLSNSQTGILYQLFVGSAPTGAPVSGTGSLLDFGSQTTSGTYSIIATNTTTGCTSIMTGTTTIGISPLPTPFTVTGGGNYCPGGSGSLVGLSNSVAGTVYQLFKGSLSVGTAVSGSGAPISFGLQTATGTYTVVATNLATGCSISMTGSVTVGIASLPVVFNVTGTSNYCPGGSGSIVGLSGSAIGVTYQLFKGGVAVGAPFTGTGSALNFGLWTSGTYTVVATTTATTCTNNMNGSAVIGISPLPTAHTVTGGGNYCVGGTGVHVGLNGSDAGTWYQLYDGTTPAGTAMAGTGLPLDFGLQTGSGTYTVFANSTSTSCSGGMSGSVVIGTNPLPSTFAVTGGGNYCMGGAGSNISLSGSATGITYQLFLGSTSVGSSVAGTGSSISFGNQTAAGTYTVVASNSATTCSNNMTGSATVMINPLPFAYTVTGGGNYCSGTGGVHVMLSGSTVGTTYQLFAGGTPVGGAMSGTGLGLDFGSQTISGVYTVVGTNPVTGCSGPMSGSVNISVTALPTAYTLSSTGSSYCAGGAGIDIVLSGSDISTNYQLYNGTTPVGGSVAGTSAAIDFGYHTGTGTYTVVAVNTSTTCTSNMSGLVIVTIGALPTAYTITGGGNYCSGGSGVHIGLSGSNAGVTYQLYQGATATGGSVTGTGASLDFGLITAAGTYTITGTNAGTGCTGNMAGTVTITVTTPPTAYNVTGGGNYCSGGSGVHAGLSGSASGITYQLFRSGIATGTAVPGTGFPIDFGLQTLNGSYTVVATSSSTGCSNNMTGSVTVFAEPLPASFTVIGGGNYCPGGTGEHVGISGSTTGITYQLFNGGVASGSPHAGTGSSLDFGLQTAPGVYTVVAYNGTTSCSANMAGSVTIGINPLPNVYAVDGGGNYCAGGSGVHIGLTGSDAGISYQAWGTSGPTGSPVIGTGAPLDLGAETAAGTYTVVASNSATTCSDNMSGNAEVVVIMTVTPTVSINSSGGDTVCSGILTDFTAVTVNGGTSPVYTWTINGVVVGVGNGYNYIPVNGDLVSVTLTSNAQCATPSTVTSELSITVNTELTPAITIAANPGVEVCRGTSVTFTSSETGGGNSPTYSWIKNGSNVGSTSTYTYAPSNGDAVYCIMTSNYHCRTANTGTSNQLNMIVDNPSTPVVNVSANPAGHVNVGEPVTFTATASSAGPAPTYQWFVNGVAIPGATFPVYTGSGFNTGDSVCCEVTSSGGCSGIIGRSCTSVILAGVGVQPVVFSGSDIRLIPNPNNGLFTLKGTLGNTNDEEMTVEVMDVIGQVIYSGKITVHNGDLNEKIQLNNLANGMYIVNLRSGSDYKVFHMVIEQ